MWQLYKMVQRREWIVDFDYCKRIKINADAEPRYVIRRSFLITKDHVGAKGPGVLSGASIQITENDIGRVFVIDEHEDGVLSDYIIDPKMHPTQWEKLGGFKLNKSI